MYDQVLFSEPPLDVAFLPFLVVFLPLLRPDQLVLVAELVAVEVGVATVGKRVVEPGPLALEAEELFYTLQPYAAKQVVLDVDEIGSKTQF